MKTIILSQWDCSASDPYSRCARYASLVLLAPTRGALNGCRFRENLAALLPPHSPFELQAGRAGDVLAISFAPGFPDLPAGGAPLLAPDVPEALTQYFLTAFRLLGSFSCPEPNTGAEACIRALALCLAQPGTDSRADRSHARKIVNQAQQIISWRYASELTLQAVAGELFVNPCYLSTIFRQVTGRTFRSYLKTVRLQHAKRLLIETNDQITDIAMQTGFNSAAYLISSFRQAFGVTPSAYRNQQLDP